MREGGQDAGRPVPGAVTRHASIWRQRARGLGWLALLMAAVLAVGWLLAAIGVAVSP